MTVGPVVLQSFLGAVKEAWNESQSVHLNINLEVPGNNLLGTGGHHVSASRYSKLEGDQIPCEKKRENS